LPAVDAANNIAAPTLMVIKNVHVTTKPKRGSFVVHTHGNAVKAKAAKSSPQRRV